MLVSSIREAELVSFEFCRKIVGTSARYYSPLIGTEFKLDAGQLYWCLVRFGMSPITRIRGFWFWVLVREVGGCLR